MKIKLEKSILLLLVPMMLASCGTPTIKDDGFDPNNNDIGYQWEDVDAPILEEKETVEFDVLAIKNALALEYNEMKVFKDLYDYTHVDVDYRNITETAYEAQKTLILANASQHPDAIYHASFTNKELMQYGSARNVIIAFDEYLEYMPNLSRILKARPDIQAAITDSDGHIYSLPRVEEMGLVQYPNILFLNKEWVTTLINDDKLSFDLSIDDLNDGLKLKRSQYKEILTKFKTEDLNGNGENDEIPLSFVSQNWQGNESDLIASFGLPANNGFKTIVNDKVDFIVQDEKFKTAIDELSGWVKDGLIEKSVFEDSQDIFLAKGKLDSQGNQRMGSFYWWEKETVLSESEYDNYIIVEPLIDDATNKQYVGVSNELEVRKGQVVVFEKTEKKEILLTYLDRFYDPYTSAQVNYGPIGIVYEEELNANGQLVNKPLPDGVTTDELRLKNAPLGIMYLSDEEWENNVVMEPRAVLRQQRLDSYVKPYTYEGAKGFPNISYTLSEINALAADEIILSETISSAYVKWMVDGSGVSDAQWSDFQSDLVKAGIEDVKKINQTGYDRFIEEQK